MSIPSGNGGYVLPAELSNPVAVAVGRWAGDWDSRLAEVTQSDSGGGTAYKHVVEDPKWTAEFAFDDTIFIETLGWDSGTELEEIFFKKGASALCDLVSNTTVETVNYTCDNQGDVVRVRVTGKGGTVTTNVGVPIAIT